MIAKLASEPHINRRTIYVIEVKFKKINGVFIPFCGIFSITRLILIHMNRENNRIVEIQL